MTYIPTPLKREIIIDAVVTIHYFEYMRDFVFPGEFHDFWEFLYVDKGILRVTAGDHTCDLTSGQMIFHEPGEFHALSALGAAPIRFSEANSLSAPLWRSF